jgi:ATP-dependent Clp protease ATP-binding subunit ClpX
MFEIPGSDVLSVHITDESVLRKAEPVYIRGRQVDSTEAAEDDSEMQARAEVK